MLIGPNDIVPPSGSVEGFTVQNSKGGPYIRARTQHVDPWSPAQQALTARWRNAGGRWTNTLTPTQRDAWALYAALTPIDTRGKGLVFLSPSAMYMRTAIVRSTVGLAPVDDAPVIFDTGSFTTPTVTANEPNTITVTFNETDDWVTQDGSALVIHEHNQSNITVQHQRNTGRNTGAIFGSSTSPPTSPQNLTTKGTLDLGNGCHIEVRLCDPDGRVTEKTRIPVILIGDIRDCSFCLGAICADCPDGTPISWAVQYFNLTTCPCINCGDVARQRSLLLDTIPIGGTGAPLDQLAPPSQCIWTSRAPLNTFGLKNFIDIPDCDGPSFAGVGRIQTQIHRQGTTMVVEGLILNLGAGGVCTDTGIFFKAEIPLASCCFAFTAANQLIGRPCGSREPTVQQGTAIVVGEATNVFVFPCATVGP